MSRINQKKVSILNTPRSGNILINTRTQLKERDSIQNKETYVAINGKDISYDHKNFSYNAINNIDDNLIENLQIQNVYQLESKIKYIFSPGNYQLVTLLAPTNPAIDDFFCVVLDKNTNQHSLDSNIFKIVYVIDSYYIDLSGVVSFHRGNAFSTYTFYWNGQKWIRYETLSENKKNIWNDENILFFDKNLKINQQTNNQIKHYASGLSSSLIGNNLVNIQKIIASPSKMDFFVKDQSITKSVDNLIEHKNFLENCITPFKDYNIKEINNDFNNGVGDYSFIESKLLDETTITLELDVPVDSLLEYTSKMQQQDLENDEIYFFSSWQNSPHSFRNVSGPLSNLYLSRERTNSPFLIYNFAEKCFESRGWSRKSQSEGNQITEIPDLNFFYLPLFNQPIQPTDESFELFRDSLTQNLKNHNFALTNTPINDLCMYQTTFDIQSGTLDTSLTNGVFVSKIQNNLSLPTAQYGFPHFPVFHLFDENTISMKKYINKNFIIDRVTAELDIQLQSETTTNQNEEDIDIKNGLKFSLNYFILNNSNNKKSSHYLNLSPFKIDNITSSLDIYSKISSTFFTKDYIATNQNHPDNLALQSFNITRKLFKAQNENENNYDGLTNIKNSQITFDDISFNKDIVSFGNVVFFAPNKLTSFVNDQPKKYTNEQVDENLKTINNCDLFIDTFYFNSFDKGLLDDDKIFLDFDNNVKINSYVKKNSNTFLTFSSNNFNYQIDFKSDLGLNNVQAIDGNKKKFKSQYHSRNMLSGKISGKDLINVYSNLENVKKFSNAKTDLKLFKNMKNADGVLWSDLAQVGESLAELYYINYINLYNTNFYTKKNTNFSPYILTPTDNLAFGFSISPNISPKLFKHNCKIKKGKVVFKLHGYLQKNQEKINDWTNLTTQNQENVNTNIVGNTFVYNEKYNAGYRNEYIDTIYDRAYIYLPFYQAYNSSQFPLFSGDTPYQLLKAQQRKFNSSSILTGSAYISTVKVSEKIDRQWLYDNDIPYKFILNILTNTSNGIFAKLGTEYRGIVINSNYQELLNPDPLLDTGPKEYTDYNIAAITTIFKKNITNLNFAQESLEKYNFSCYFSFKKYGQFADFWQQRLYSTTINKIQNVEIINPVVTQEFIDNTTGLVIENMKNVITRNKSKTLELYNSGYKSVTDDGIITPWDAEDFFKLKHVAFFEAAI